LRVNAPLKRERKNSKPATFDILQLSKRHLTMEVLKNLLVINDPQVGRKICQARLYDCAARRLS